MTRTLRARLAGRRLAAAAIVAGALAIAPLAATTASGATAHPAGPAARLHPFTIVSPNFRDGGFLPVSAEFGGPGSQGSGCSGQNLAPRLIWFNIPAGTKGFAFTINDVDAPVAGGFHHWVVYNIPRGHPFLAGHGQNPFSEAPTATGRSATAVPARPPPARS